MVDQIREELAHAGYLKGRRPKQADTKKRKAAAPQPAEYTLPTGHRLFVGRNNAQNDDVTWLENPDDVIVLANHSRQNFMLDLPAGRYRLDAGRRMRTMRSIGEERR